MTSKDNSFAFNKASNAQVPLSTVINKVYPEFLARWIVFADSPYPSVIRLGRKKLTFVFNSNKAYNNNDVDVIPSTS